MEKDIERLLEIIDELDSLCYGRDIVELRDRLISYCLDTREGDWDYEEWRSSLSFIRLFVLDI